VNRGDVSLIPAARPSPVQYRSGLPVILNLTDADDETRKRIVDFALAAGSPERYWTAKALTSEKERGCTVTMRASCGSGPVVRAGGPAQQGLRRRPAHDSSHRDDG